MKDLLHQIARSKFLIIGLFIGTSSAEGDKVVMNPSGHSVALWIFFIPLILAYIFFKLWKKNKR